MSVNSPVSESRRGYSATGNGPASGGAASGGASGPASRGAASGVPGAASGTDAFVEGGALTSADAASGTLEGEGAASVPASTAVRPASWSLPQPERRSDPQTRVRRTAFSVVEGKATRVYGAAEGATSGAHGNATTIIGSPGVRAGVGGGHGREAARPPEAELRDGIHAGPV